MTSEPSRGSAPFPAIPGYRVLRLLGAGGMGRVYLAEDEALGRSVAVKVVAERFEGAPEARARFLREARAMATVEHPAVVRIYSYGEREGAVYFVMEYVEGEPLSERLLRGRLPLDAALQLLEQTTDALEAAFEKGVVHRDIKPGNILLDKKGRAHVADFGLAKPLQSASEPSLTDTGAILGTPYYVSPEQARGLPVDFRGDIYSLGILAFEALAGDRPFVGTTSFEVVAKHIHEPLPDLRRRRPDVPEPVARAIEWMTAKDPAARPPSYAALRQALGIATAADALAASPTQTRLRDGASTLRPPPTARRWRRALAGAAALLVLAAAFLMSRRSGSGRVDDRQLVVAVAPFYGLDDESAKEGRLMASLVEREVVRRLGTEGVRVKGVDETQQPVRDHAAARALGERLGASVVVWGDVFALRGETEIQPSFTLVLRPARDADESRAIRTALAGRDPSDALRDMSGPSRTTPSASAIELRKTSAAGVSDLVMVLAGMHTLYNEGNAEKALALFERAPKSAQSLRHRAEALLRLRRPDAAMGALQEAIALDPADAAAHAALGDLLLESDRLLEADRELRRAAELGGRYATRNGIVFEDKLYLRETFREWREQAGRGQRVDSGYLVTVDAASARVLERHRLPGVMQFSLSVGDGVLRISYADPRPGAATFAGGRFEKPSFYGSHLRLRRLAFDSGRALAANFLDGYDWRKTPDPKQSPWGPATLPDLAARLREAAERDPTQPWHLFFLGQALKAQERGDEARQAWTALFAGVFPGTPYFEYSYMARLFETWGERPWADRAFAEALARRKLVPQPIESCTLIERLISASFIQAAPQWTQRGSDLERIHSWVERARELTGTAIEGDDLTAAAWSGYFRRRGDETRAAREAQLVVKARRLPGVLEGYAAAFDAATQVFLSLSFAAWAFLLLCLRPWRRYGGWRGVVAAAPPEARRVALGACALALLAFVWLARSGLDFRGLDAPLALMDSLGSAENVSELERRLALLDRPKIRFAAAVANHMAGNLDRARELYGPLQADPRVRSNMNALQAGLTAPREPLTAEDYFRAYQERPWSHWLPGAWAWGVDEIVRDWEMGRLLLFSSVADALALLLGAGLFLRVPPVREPRDVTDSAGRLWKALPGAVDVWRGASVRGYITLCLLCFSVVVLWTQLRTGAIVPTAGIVSAKMQPLKGLPWPLSASTPTVTDADLERALRPFYWDFLRARPHVAALWAAAFLAFAAALVLHVQAVRALSLAGRPSPP